MLPSNNIFNQTSAVSDSKLPLMWELVRIRTVLEQGMVTFYVLGEDQEDIPQLADQHDRMFNYYDTHGVEEDIHHTLPNDKAY